jgi:hypothetical protein
VTSCNHEVTIQDLAPLGARLYLTGHIYFADSRRCTNPKFFAPYLTKECLKSVLTLEVTTGGISCYSEVVDVIRPTFDELFGFPDGYQPSSGVAAHPSWPLWCTGILVWQLTAERAIKAGEDWRKYPPQHVYLLGEPTRLGNRVLKAPGQTMVSAHYWARLSELSAVSHLGQLKRP